MYNLQNGWEAWEDHRLLAAIDRYLDVHSPDEIKMRKRQNKARLRKTPQYAARGQVAAQPARA
jgi:hypothetical protein